MFALTQIKGVGRRYSNLVCKKADVDLSKRYVSTTINDFGINLQCLESGVEYEGSRQGSTGMNYTNDLGFSFLYRLESPLGNDTHTQRLKIITTKPRFPNGSTRDIADRC